MSADALMPISVVLERRAIDSQWQDHVWQPIGVLPRASLEPGTLMAEGEGWAHYHGGALDLELYRGETEGYLYNLSQTSPVVFVVLRRNDEAKLEQLEFEPFLATLCPYEAMGYSESNDELIVEGVPMPPEVMEWAREFVMLHHVDVPFKKRKNKRHQAANEDTQPRPGGNRDLS